MKLFRPNLSSVVTFAHFSRYLSACLPMSVPPPCCALTASFAKDSMNTFDAAEVLCRLFRYDFDDPMSCFADGLNFSRMFCE